VRVKPSERTVYAAGNSFGAISLMSAPAAKAFVDPVITIAPIFGSASYSLSCADNSAISGLQRAFNAGERQAQGGARRTEVRRG
jgi:hypothetical protein